MVACKTADVKGDPQPLQRQVDLDGGARSTLLRPCSTRRPSSSTWAGPCPGQELDVIKSGRIQYKKADIQEASVRVIGTTAIVLNRIRLLAVVGGNEVTNPFVVTEVYVQQDDEWKLASLSFTRLLGA